MSAPATWIPLDRAALCLDDEAVFDVSDGECPSCGGAQFMLLVHWLQEDARQ